MTRVRWTTHWQLTVHLQAGSTSWAHGPAALRALLDLFRKEKRAPGSCWCSARGGQTGGTGTLAGGRRQRVKSRAEPLEAGGSAKGSPCSPPQAGGPQGSPQSRHPCLALLLALWPGLGLCVVKAEPCSDSGQTQLCVAFDFKKDPRGHRKMRSVALEG